MGFNSAFKGLMKPGNEVCTYSACK